MPMPELLSNLHRHHHHHGRGKVFFRKVGHGIGKAAKVVGKGTVKVGKYAVNHPGTIGQGILAGVSCATAPIDGGLSAPACGMAVAKVASKVGSDIVAGQ